MVQRAGNVPRSEVERVGSSLILNGIYCCHCFQLISMEPGTHMNPCMHVVTWCYTTASPGPELLVQSVFAKLPRMSLWGRASYSVVGRVLCVCVCDFCDSFVIMPSIAAAQDQHVWWRSGVPCSDPWKWNPIPETDRVRAAQQNWGLSIFWMTVCQCYQNLFPSWPTHLIAPLCPLLPPGGFRGGDPRSELWWPWQGHEPSAGSEAGRCTGRSNFGGGVFRSTHDQGESTKNHTLPHWI